MAATNYDGTFSAVTVLTFPELEVLEKDVVTNKGGSGGEVVDLDWSTDGAWVSCMVGDREGVADSFFEVCYHNAERHRFIFGLASTTVR